MILFRVLILTCISFAAAGVVCAEDKRATGDYYTITPYVLPGGVKLEASGLAVLPGGSVAVSVRKGEIWIIKNPTADPTNPEAVGYQLFASGLHEPLGLLWHDGALYTAQRSEVTRISDTDGDGVADDYQTVAKGWGVSGNYHEYAYGPALDKEGNMWITLNSSMGPSVKMPGFRQKEKPWRGWAVSFRPEGGPLLPMAGGLRSPCGIGSNAEGDVFTTDQQGNWMGTNPLFHLRKGAFFGHADSIADTRRPDSPVADPGKLPEKMTVVEAARTVPGLALPAVWFPYVKAGQSPTGIICDQTDGKFGPFGGQLFVGEFVLSGLNRVYLEKVNGEYQGAVFNFLEGLQSAALSLAFLPDGSLLVGESNRGWNSKGTRSFGLERIQWTGKMPFEIEKMQAVPGGFLLTFTEQVSGEVAQQVTTYEMSSYTYLYQHAYGSPEVDSQPVKVVSARLENDGKSVRLTCEGLRAGYVHELNLPKLVSVKGATLLHPAAYYTLNHLAK